MKNKMQKKQRLIRMGELLFKQGLISIEELKQLKRELGHTKV